MKALTIFFFCLVSLVFADDDGQYRPESYGSDDGRYVPGDEGQYIHREGPDNGIYRSEGSNAGRFGNSFRSNFVPIPANNAFINRFVVDTAATNLAPFSQPVRNVYSQQAVVRHNDNPAVATNSFISTQRFAPAVKSFANPEAQSRILRQDNDIGLDSYHYGYETENNIKVEEDGRLVNANTKNEAVATRGFYEYIGPDNIRYRVDYIADENGFQPVGAHLPTPPPIPEAIAKILVNVSKK